MTKEWFHHPDFSLPVVRRRVGDELLELIAGGAELVLSRGRSLVHTPEGAVPASVRNALCRLRRKGLIVRTGPRSGPVALRLTGQGRQAVSEVNRPEALWKRKWSGRWHMLVYDVPEAHKTYRNVLRGFLRRLRMGRLQNSVWISPRDIRPDFDDLCRAADVAAFAYLFESRTVLGLSAATLVEGAWDFHAVRRRQRWYLQESQTCLDGLQAGRMKRGEFLAAARADAQAYRSIMDVDPLLPSELWPPDYQGPEVVARHRALQRALAEAASR